MRGLYKDDRNLRFKEVEKMFTGDRGTCLSSTRVSLFSMTFCEGDQKERALFSISAFLYNL